MSDQDRLDLMRLVESDKNHIVQFLLAHNIQVRNKITMLFSDGDVDENRIDQLSFTNLWELQYEPSLIKVEFVIERPKESHSNITGILENLLNKIVDRDSPLNSGNTIDSSNTCPHFKSIKIDEQQNGISIVMVGAICYCS
jgi:hypothetical protein